MDQEKIALEPAEHEFERFVVEWDIDSNIDAMTAETLEGFNQHKSRILNKIMSGQMVVQDDATQIAFTLGYPQTELTEIIFRIPTGSAYLSMDSHKDRENMHKMSSFLGQMTKKAPLIFSKMDGRDIKVCHAVASLFLGS